MEGKFELGKIVATAGVAARMDSDFLFKTFVGYSIERHRRGIWGDLCKDDIKVNEAALKYGDRLMSVYKDVDVPDIWIITESNRKITTVLFPEEY